MFVFVIPFKSRARCANWRSAALLCENAIASMLANPSPDLRVILVCSEIPERMPSDSRLIVKSVSLQTPHSQFEMMTDKYLKCKIGLATARQFAPTWLTCADADDLISNRLVNFMTAQKPYEFWYSEYGWRYSVGSRFVIKLPHFHQWCGTSNVNYVTEKDLPKSVDDPMRSYLLEFPHPQIVEQRKTMGIRVRPIPFPTTIY